MRCRVLRLSAAVTVVLLAMLLACSGPEEKKQKFLEKGRALYEQGDLINARLELKNALQIDPKYALAHYELGRVELKDRNLPQAFGLFKKAVALDPELFDAQLELGKLLLAVGQKEEARGKIDLVLSKRPHDNDARLALAALLIDEEKAEAALTELDALRKGGEQRPEVFFLLSAVYQRQEKPDRIEAVLKEGVAANPGSIVLHVLLARHYAAQKRSDEVVVVLQKIIDMEPDKTAHRLNLAKFQWANQNRDKAEAVIAAMLAHRPTDPEYIREAAGFYLGVGELDAARKILHDGLAKHPKNFALRFQMADLDLAANQPKDAQALLTETLTLSQDAADPNILEAHNRLARLHLARRDPDAAEKEADIVLSQNARSIDASLVKGTVRLIRGDGQNAVSAFRTVVQERPDDVNAHLQLARAHMLNQESALAEDTVKNALKASPRSKPAHEMLLRIQIANKELDAAEAHLREMIGIFPDDPQILTALGEFLERAGKPDAALAQYRALEERFPDIPAGYIKLAQVKMRAKDLAGAAAIMNRGYERTHHPILLSSLADVYLALRQPDMAIALCRAHIVQAPDDPIAYNTLGKIYRGRKAFAEAEAAFQKAVELRPVWPNPINNLAALYLAQGKTGAALSRLETALRDNPRNLAAYMIIGNIHMQQKEPKKAIAVYEQALIHIPDNANLLNNLAYLMSSLDGPGADFQQALTYAEKALTLQPQNPTVLDTVGWIHLNMGQLDKAAQLFEQALPKAPDSAVLNYHFALVRQRQGNRIEARQYLEKALASNEHFEERGDAEKLFHQIEGSL